MIHYVNGFLFSRDSSTVAMVRKKKPAWQDGLFNGIGGKIEPGETAIGAMIREFQEETGVYFAGWDHFTTIEGDGFCCHFYKGWSELVYEVKTIEEEPIFLINPRSMPYETIENVRWMVPMILDTNTVAPVRFRHGRVE